MFLQKYENKENNHVVYFPLNLLCTAVCDFCFYSKIRKETSKIKGTGNNLGDAPKAALYA